MQVYRGLPILTNQPSRPTRARRDLRARRGDVGRRVRHARARGDRRARRPHGRARSSAAGPVSISGRRSRTSRCRRPRRRRARARRSGGRARPARAHARLARARSARGSGRPPQRPPARRPRARARRGRRVARAGGRPPLGERHAAPDADRRARRPARRARAADRRAHRRDVRRAGSSTEVRRALARPRLADRREGARPQRDRRSLPEAEARERIIVVAPRRTPAVPAEVDAADPGRSSALSTRPSTRACESRRREVARCSSRSGTRSATATSSSSSPTPARSPLTARAAALLGRRGHRLGRRARGDRTGTAHAPIVTIWNPDGSTAEMSGNGTRIAARWLAAESGATEVTIETAGRAASRARMLNALETDTDVGEVTVGAPESRRRDRADDRVGRQPARRRPPRRPDARRPPPPRPADRDAPAVPGAHERPARPGRRPPRPDRARLGAWSGGDERVRLVVGRRGGGRGRARVVRQPGHGAPPGRRPARAARGRAGALTAAERVAWGRRS